jgi:hypothetical protein
MFSNECCSDTSKIARGSSDRVIEQLEEKGYPRLTGDHRKPASDRSYRYLTDMSILSLTTDKLADLEKKMQEFQAEYDDYLNTTVEEIWLRELNEFSKSYNTFLKDWQEDNEHNNTADPKAKGKGGKRKARATKAKGGAASKASKTKSSSNGTGTKKVTAKKATAKPKGRARVTKAKAAGQSISVGTGKSGSGNGGTKKAGAKKARAVRS